MCFFSFAKKKRLNSKWLLYNIVISCSPATLLKVWMEKLCSTGRSKQRKIFFWGAKQGNRKYLLLGRAVKEEHFSFGPKACGKAKIGTMMFLFFKQVEILYGRLCKWRCYCCILNFFFSILLILCILQRAWEYLVNNAEGILSNI